MEHASVAMTNKPVRITRLRENRDGQRDWNERRRQLYGTNESDTIVGLHGNDALTGFGGPTSTTSILLSDRGHT
jgi:hypothetical protein